MSEAIALGVLYVYCAAVAAYGTHVELPNVKRAATWPKSVHWLAVVALALVGPASFLGFILGCMVYAWTEVAKITWPGLMTLFRWLRFTVIDCFMRRLAV